MVAVKLTLGQSVWEKRIFYKISAKTTRENVCLVR